MQRQLLILILLVCMLFAVPSSGLVAKSGTGVWIGEPIDDDVFANGGTIIVDAPVGSLTAAGGTVTVNAPVRGDVIAAGGQVTINADVGGKVVAAGGTVTVNGRVGTNAALAGGDVTLGSGSQIGRDATVYGGTVANHGNVAGTLWVTATTFTNTGTAGHLVVEQFTGTFIALFVILFTIGLLILGLILIWLAPHRFQMVEKELLASPLKAVVGGFIGIFAGFILLVILAITMVGLPLALFLGFLWGMALLLSTLFASSVLGRWIGSLLKKEFPLYTAFIIGFVILNLLYRIPYLGSLVYLVAMSLGFGAILLTIWNNKKMACGPRAA